MQPNIPMKFAVYVAWILLCKHYKFGEKIHYNSGDIEFFLGDYFFLARPVHYNQQVCKWTVCLALTTQDYTFLQSCIISVYTWI